MGEQILKETQGQYHPDYATSLNNLALFYFFIGDYNRAVDYGNKSIHLYQEVIGGNYSGYSASLCNLSIYYNALGDYKKAMEYGLQAENITKTRYGETDHGYAAILSNLANYYSNYGNYEKAIECVNKSMSIIGENDYYYSTCLNNLANYYSYLGNYKKAIECGIKAINHTKTTHGEKHLEYAHSFDNLIGYYSTLGEYSNSLDCLQQSTSVIHSNILLFFENLSTNLRSSLWSQNSFYFTDLYPSIFYRSPTHNASDLYDKSALFAKGLLLTTEIEMNRLIQESGDEEALKMFDELRVQKIQLQKLYETALAEQHLDADSLAQIADQLERKLMERSKVYGDFSKKLRTTWQDVQNSLAEDEMAVEFLSFNVYDTDSTMVAALTLRKDDIGPKFTPLFDLGQLKEVGDTTYFICPEVTNLVWGPLQNELQGIRRVYFSPAGVLHKIAIEYAPGMEEYEMYRLSTTREIIDMKASATPKGNDNTIAALYGGVDYEKIDNTGFNSYMASNVDAIIDDFSHNLSLYLHRSFVDSLDLRGKTIDYLPSTLTEVQNIQTAMKEANHRASIYFGPDATETSVKSLSGKAPSILHIATHGFYFTESQARKRDDLIFLANDDQRGGNVEDKSLTRSGLFMAGANRSLKGEDISMESDDGILTAQEISRLDLRGTDLVVLSACDTGRGDIKQGEGVFGLQRSFKKAGVQTIVMSLWKVNDSSTEMLMTEFYKNLCNGKSKRESLRLAQQKVREHKDADGKYLFKDPHYWAGFVILD